MTPLRIKAGIAALAALTLFASAAPALTQTKLTTGLPVPRFVTLKAKKINLRVGPGQDYAVSWRFLKAGLPVEVTQEFENWRRIRDADGSEGWVFHSLLSGERNAIAAPWMREKGTEIFVDMRRDADEAGRVVAKLQPGVVVKLDKCTGLWCHAHTKEAEGWVNQAEIWGAYPGEAFTK
jgi:SH3-like domain-containing protein